MTLTKLVNGLNILKEYYHRGDAYLSAMGDEVYCPKTDLPISKEDFDYLISIGWQQVDEEDLGNDPFVYDERAGWSFYL